MVASHSPYQETIQSLPKTAESTPKRNCTSLPILSPSDLPSQQTSCVDETLEQHPTPLRPLQYYDCYNCKAILSVAVGSSTELFSCELKKYFIHYLVDDGKSLLSNLCQDKYRHFCGDDTVYLNPQYFLEWHKKTFEVFVEEHDQWVRLRLLDFELV